MTPPRNTLRTLGVLGIAAVVASGCGGGGEEAAAPDPGVAPTPAPADGTGAVTGDGTVPQDLDGDGIPDAAPAADLGATAEIPDLSGGDVSGGLAAPSNNSPLFEAGALEPDEFLELNPPKDESSTDTGVTSPDTSTPDPAPAFSGAKIYVDGVVHDVDNGAAFPKDNPVFRLVTVTGTNIEVELIAGEFTSGGGSGVLIDKGELVSLVNASEQLTYRVKFLRPVSGGGGISF